MDREGFFRESRLSDEKFERLYDGLPDARVMVREMIGSLLPDREVIVPEEDGERYSDAVIRIAVEGDSAALHRDSALEYFKGWMVSQFPTQFSALVCLQMADSGGELHVYRRRWTPEDDARKVDGATGYPPSLVEGAPLSTVVPQDGDLYIFHPGDLPRHRPDVRPPRPHHTGNLLRDVQYGQARGHLGMKASSMPSEGRRLQSSLGGRQ